MKDGLHRKTSGDNMRLSREDTDLFYKLNWSLLFYVNKKYAVIQGINTPDFKNQDFNKIAEIHEKFFSNPELIDEIEDITAPYLPSLVGTVLLPFKGKIIHYGLFHFHDIHFGSGIKKDIQVCPEMKSFFWIGMMNLEHQK